MNVLVVYCHPSQNSFTHSVKEAFVKGLTDAGHSAEICDLYAMGFSPIFSQSEYQREAYYDESKAVPEDVLTEQQKINHADIIAFIYPNFWTEAPALLLGWFQRVFTYGFAYGEHPKMKTLEKALFLVTMGGSLKDAVRREQVEAMKTVMIGDRIHNRTKSSEMIVFDEMTRGYGNEKRRDENAQKFLNQAYDLGFKL